MAEDEKKARCHTADSGKALGHGGEIPLLLQQPKSRTDSGMAAFDLSTVDESIDSSLDALELQAKKFVGDLSFVKREKMEIDFLKLIEILRDILETIVKCDDRGALIKALGPPYTRLARVRYMLECVPLSEKRASDPRFMDLKEAGEIIESVLKDANKGFKTWQDLKKEGLFEPAFEDPDAGSDADGEAPGGGSFTGDESPAAGNSQAANEAQPEAAEDTSSSLPSTSRADDVPSKAAAPSATPEVRFAQTPSGKYAHFLRSCTVVTRLAEGDDQNAVLQMTDEIAMGLDKAGMQNNIGRSALYYSRKLMSGNDDAGCTAMSNSPIKKFPGLGQYAEVRVEAVRSESILGCFGVGVTTISPKSESWAKSSSSLASSLFRDEKFPKRLDSFPGPSWIFSGPYKGKTRRLYIDGTSTLKYVDQDENPETSRWKAGDVVGILVGVDGRLTLYTNGKKIVSAFTPGLQDLADKGDIYLVVECFGYVVACSIVAEADPSKLEIEEAAPPQAVGRLSYFLKKSVTSMLNSPAGRAGYAAGDKPDTIAEE